MKKSIESIFSGCTYEILNLGENCELSGMEYDSRKIESGYIFAALEGAVVDGHSYIKNSIEKGAKLVIVSKKVDIIDSSVSYVLVENLRQKLGIIASNFYGWPQNDINIVGVTGTNGKTTTTYILEGIIGDVARIGTVDYRIGDEVLPAPNTTPESLDIVKICKRALEKGIKYLVMEVSSHALEMGRVDMLEFDVAVFTNLSQDHLDYHKTMEDYFLAKKKLFLKLRRPKGAILNVDDPYGKRLSEEVPCTSYSMVESSDIKGSVISYTNHSTLVNLYLGGCEHKFETKLMGKFNIYNIMGAVGAALELGFSEEEIISSLERIKTAPGRFETVNMGQNFMVVVDFAHTDDGLKNILEALNEIKKNRVITVFGAGGDRDRSKRPKMARAAEDGSNFVIATSDNPRTEDPVKILDDVKSGFVRDDSHMVIVDREEAIKKAIDMAEKDDIILIAGKGHETYQIVGRQKFHFSDKEVAEKYLGGKK